jgi:hypothetical protein
MMNVRLTLYITHYYDDITRTAVFEQNIGANPVSVESHAFAGDHAKFAREDIL